jgi:hypothetical protein
MSTLAFPLPRKITPDVPKPLRTAHVDAYCASIWRTGRNKGRGDTFIGLIDTVNWTFYLAPCFGIDAGVVDSGEPAATASLIAKGEFPDTTDVKSNSTSARDATMVTVKKSALESVYGAGNVCYTELDPQKGFDGQSHKALYRWIKNNDRIGVRDGVDWFKLLGFAIQKDNDGYYMRFASTLNEHPGQTSKYFSFVKKENPKEGRESRDLPKDWSRFVEEVLGRDLGLALIKRDWIQSRGEEQNSRLTRFEHSYKWSERRTSEGDPSLETGIRLV